MAKGAKKRVRNGQDQSGCMWGLINIFDFRHGSPSLKLLADRKRGSKRIVGAASPSPSPGDVLNRLEEPCEMCKDCVFAGEQYETATMDKLSVKALMEEEMFELQSHPNLIPGQIKTDKQGHGRKKSWCATKKSFDSNDIHIVSDKPAHRKNKSLSSLDVTGMMAELNSHAHVKDIECLSNHQIDENVAEDPSVSEEVLGEATRVFVRHFVDGRNIEEGKIQSSTELTEALRILNSNKDMFLKLLRDPSSQLVKHLKILEDHEVYRDESPESQAGSDSNLTEQGKRRHHMSFWRRFKGLDRNSSKHLQDAKPIVVLKPQTAGPQSSPDIRSEDQNERPSSRFFFIELTRKLKLVTRKEQPHSVSVADSNIAGEIPEMASPSRNRFFVEKIPNYSAGSKKGASTPEQRISNIYTEAKRHLAEIVGNSDVDVEVLSRPVPKSLGKILSYADYNKSPLCSPRISGTEIVQFVPQRVQEENVSESGLVDNSSCMTVEETTDDLEVPKDEHSPLLLAVDDIHPEEMESLDDVDEPCSPSTSRNEQAEETQKDSEEEEQTIDQPSSPLASSSAGSRTEELDDPEAMTDKSERPSPISILEPIFIDDDVSPPSSKSYLVSELIQPRQIKFEDEFSRAPRLRDWEEDRSAVLEFVEVVVLESNMTHDQLLDRFLFSDHLLDPSIFDEVCFHPDYLGYDPKLLFDLVDEVLTEVSIRDFDGMPSMYQLYARLKSMRKDLVDETREGVDWYLQCELTQRTLDQTVAKDFSKPWSWMDLRLDCENIGAELEEVIIDELLEDTIMSFIGLINLSTEKSEHKIRRRHRNTMRGDLGTRNTHQSIQKKRWRGWAEVVPCASVHVTRRPRKRWRGRASEASEEVARRHWWC